MKKRVSKTTSLLQQKERFRYEKGTTEWKKRRKHVKRQKTL